MFVYIIKQLYYLLSSYMSSYTTRAHGITVKYNWYIEFNITFFMDLSNVNKTKQEWFFEIFSSTLTFFFCLESVSSQFFWMYPRVLSPNRFSDQKIQLKVTTTIIQSSHSIFIGRHRSNIISAKHQELLDEAETDADDVRSRFPICNCFSSFRNHINIVSCPIRAV